MNNKKLINKKAEFKFIKNLLSFNGMDVVKHYDECEELFYSYSPQQDESKVFELDRFERLCFAWSLKESFDFEYDSLNFLFRVISGDKAASINPLFVEELVELLKDLKKEWCLNKVRNFVICAIKHESFYGYYVGMCAFIINYMFFQHGKPIQVWFNVLETINSNIQDNKIAEAYSLFNVLLIDNYKFYIKSPSKTRNQIIESLTKIKYKYDNCGIIDIFLYGSFAKQSTNEFSDIDVFLVTTKEYNNDITEKISEELTKEFKTYIDISTSSDQNDEFLVEIIKHGIHI